MGCIGSPMPTYSWDRTLSRVLATYPWSGQEAGPYFTTGDTEYTENDALNGISGVSSRATSHRLWRVVGGAFGIHHGRAPVGLPRRYPYAWERQSPIALSQLRGITG
jgi:hypothetical protein